jgi:hypothetical protein
MKIFPIASVCAITLSIFVHGQSLGQTSARSPGSTSGKTVGSTGAASQARSPAPSPGQYKALTVWTKFALGSAYFTRPEKAKNIEVVYSFEPSEFRSDTQGNELWDLALHGQIAIGVSDDKSTAVRAIEATAFLARNSVKSPADLRTALESQRLSVISSRPTLLGESSNNALVKTADATKPELGEVK